MLITLVLVTRVMVAGRPRPADARVDFVGALLCAFGLAGITFGLIEQPLHGWGSPGVSLPLARRRAPVRAASSSGRRGAAHPMLPLALFRRRNFAIGNVETFSMYAGLGLLFFFLVLFLQQVAGFSAVEAGTTTLPVTAMMFLLSARFGALADRHGPRFFMGVGPLIAAIGLALFLRIDADVNYVTDLLPGLLVFALGLSMTVAPADRDGARRRRREQRGDRLRHEQRDRARGEPDRDCRGGRARVVLLRRLARASSSARPRAGRR